MVDKHSITTPIEAIVKDEISKIAFPTIVTITKVYNDNFVDIQSDFGVLRHIRSINQHNIGNITILVFAENDYNKPIVL